VFYRLFADATVVLHLAFVLFVVGGGLLVWRWPRLAWLHVPAAVWGAVIEFAGWICPLTPLENWLRQRAGQQAYDVSFVERYLIPLLYPEALSRDVQWMFGGLVVVINACLYAFVLRQRRNWHRVS
jgi:uncharacterized membrane protein YhhN